MKTTEIAFCSFKQYLSLDIYMDINPCTSEVMKIQFKYFVFFPSTWRIKLLIPQNPRQLFWQVQVSFYILRAYAMHLEIGRNDDHDNDGEPSDKDKITMSNMMMKNMC